MKKAVLILTKSMMDNIRPYVEVIAYKTLSTGAIAVYMLSKKGMTEDIKRFILDDNIKDTTIYMRKLDKDETLKFIMSEFYKDKRNELPNSCKHINDYAEYETPVTKDDLCAETEFGKTLSADNKKYLGHIEKIMENIYNVIRSN